MTSLLILGIVVDAIGYLGIVILCSVIFVAIILLRPDRNRWCLEEESEELINKNKTKEERKQSI